MLTGDLAWTQLRGAAELFPGVLVGVLVGALVRRRLAAELVRPLVLWVSAISALVLLVRSLLG